MEISNPDWTFLVTGLLLKMLHTINYVVVLARSNSLLDCESIELSHSPHKPDSQGATMRHVKFSSSVKGGSVSSLNESKYGESYKKSLNPFFLIRQP